MGVSVWGIHSSSVWLFLSFQTACESKPHFSPPVVISTSSQCHFNLAETCGHRGAKGPWLFSTRFVAFAKHLQYITITATTHNQINHTLSNRTNCAFRAEGHFWPDYYSVWWIWFLSPLWTISAMQNTAWWKWNPITPSVMLIICCGVVNNQHGPFMSPTSLSRSWHCKEKKKKICRGDLGE